MSPTPDLQWSDAFLDSMSMVMDAPADVVLKKIVDEYGPGKAKSVFDTLIGNLEMNARELPGKLNSFVAAQSHLPDWANQELILKGETFFQDHGPAILMILLYKSLPVVYSHRQASKVLVNTGRLAHKAEDDAIFARRIGETAQFLIDVMAPGGILPSGAGFRTALRVRMVHASIRSFVKLGNWSLIENDEPINQEELAFTLQSFSTCILDGLRTMGVPISEEDERAYLHCWNVIGQIMGIQKELLPENAAEARSLLNRIIERKSAETNEGKILAHAIVAFAEKNLPGKLFDQTPEIMIRFLCGNKQAEMVGVVYKPGILGWILPRFIRLWMGWIQKLEEHDEKINTISDKVAANLLKGMTGYFNKHKNQSFRIPESLARKWGV
jgi:ER-bound oxygenase mpaB/B'/Rubber oxygenase, catalytic domain